MFNWGGGFQCGCDICVIKVQHVKGANRLFYETWDITDQNTPMNLYLPTKWAGGCGATLALVRWHVAAPQSGRLSGVGRAGTSQLLPVSARLVPQVGVGQEAPARVPKSCQSRDDPEGRRMRWVKERAKETGGSGGSGRSGKWVAPVSAGLHRQLKWKGQSKAAVARGNW